MKCLGLWKLVVTNLFLINNILIKRGTGTEETKKQQQRNKKPTTPVHPQALQTLEVGCYY